MPLIGAFCYAEQGMECIMSLDARVATLPLNNRIRTMVLHYGFDREEIVIS